MTADEQRRVAAAALAALELTDFALAGSGAIREHGITDRPTQDVDLFTASVDSELFSAAVDRLTRGLSESGHLVTVVRRAATFARLIIRTSAGDETEIDLAADWRSGPPDRMAIGPVLSLEDAVGSKLSALYSRAETRDYLDADAIRSAGQLTDEQLLEILINRDPGFDLSMFADQLIRVDQLTAVDVHPYGVTGELLQAIQQRLRNWGAALRQQEGIL